MSASCARRGRASRRPGRPANPRARTASAGGSPSPGRSRGRACRRSRAGPRRACSSAERPAGAGSPNCSACVDVGRHGGRHVGVDADQFRRRQQRHLLRDRIAPVAALRDVARVAEALHQHDPGARDADADPSRSRSACRKSRSPAATESRHRTRPTALPPCAVGLVSGSMIFSCSMIEPGQPWVTIIGNAFGMLRAHVDEMDVEPVDLGDELRQRVQPRLDLAPVVVGRPVARELLHRRELHALRCVARPFPAPAISSRRSAGGGRRAPRPWRDNGKGRIGLPSAARVISHREQAGGARPPPSGRERSRRLMGDDGMIVTFSERRVTVPVFFPCRSWPISLAELVA